MYSETDPINDRSIRKPHHPSATATPFRWSLRRGRRPRLPTVRLGGEKKKPRRGLFLVRLCKKAKLKWLKLKYMGMLKQLNKYYKLLVKEMMEGGGTIESFQQRMLLESSFAVPAMGLTFSAYPSSYQRW